MNKSVVFGVFPLCEKLRLQYTTNNGTILKKYKHYVDVPDNAPSTLYEWMDDNIEGWFLDVVLHTSMDHNGGVDESIDISFLLKTDEDAMAVKLMWS